MSCAAASYMRSGADLRIRRHARHTQEVLHRTRGVAGLLLGFTLLVHAGREALGQIGAHSRRSAPRQLARLHEGGLRLVELVLVEVRLRDDGPRDALLGDIDRRLPRQESPRDTVIARGRSLAA